MAMPSSGPISMAQAHAEFGLGYNIAAFRGCDLGVPTSGAISLWHLYGKVSGFACYRLDTLVTPGSNAGGFEIQLVDVFGNVVGISSIAAASTSVGNVNYLIDGDVTNGSNYHFHAGNGAGTYYNLQVNSRKRLSKVRINETANSIKSFNLYGTNNPASLSNIANMTFIKSLALAGNSISGWNDFNL